jgi:hypothetical protein
LQESSNFQVPKRVQERCTPATATHGAMARVIDDFRPKASAKRGENRAITRSTS